MSDAASHRRSSRASSRRSSASNDEPNESVHPHEYPIDISGWTVDDIKAHLDRLGDRMDFVSVADTVIKEIFITERVMTKYYNKSSENILYPPGAKRRTAMQIREFYNYGRKQQQEVITQYEDYQIVIADTTATTIEDENETDTTSSPESQLCCGFTLQHIRDMNPKDREEGRIALSTGFRHVVRNGYRMRSDLTKVPPDAKPGALDTWSKHFAPPVVGVLTNGNDMSDIRWRIEEQQHNPGVDQFEYHSIHTLACKGDTIVKQGLCKACADRKDRLIEQLRNAVKIRENPVHPNTKNIALSRNHSTKDEKINHLKQQKRKLSKKIAAQKKVIESLTEKTGVGLPMTKMGDEIFSDEHEANVKKFLDQDNVAEDSIVRYAFSEAVRKQKLAREGKKNGVRHCPLMIRLGIVVRKKMGYSGGVYDILAKVAGLPSDRTIRRYKIPNSNDPDGFMHPNLQRARDKFNKDYPDATKFDFRRHGSTAFDAMITKGRFAANYHTNHLVGASEDAFEEDIIKSELKQLENAEVDDSKSPALPELARNFLVFIFTTWAPEKKQQILVARYGLKSITATFLKNTIRQVAIVLAKYGFIMDTVVGDGAQENRAAFKLLATITAQDIFKGKVPDSWLEGLDLKFKIGFKHPSPVYANITIVIGGEMPHWVKKFRNAMDSNKRELTYKKQKLTLDRIYEIWKASGDADVAAGAGLRRYNKTHDHFRLDSYLKMRVFLAVQIPSQNTITMIKDYYEEADGNIEEDFSAVIKIFDRVDRLVDIMNGTGYKNGKNKGVELMNKPNHKHIEELFDILRVFEDWKTDAKGFTNKYITKYTYEDLVWMVFGVAAIPVLYLKSDGSMTMHQGRSGSDVCEHFFAMIRYINQNPTMQQCREGASSVSSDNISSNLFTFKGKQNAVGAKREAADYMQEMKTNTQKKQKTD